MKYIREYREGDRVSDIYLCKSKSSATTKNGKPYDNVVLQDKTGTLDAKIWDPHSAGIDEFEPLDYIEVYGEITSFAGALQVNVKRVRKCRTEECNPADYLPSSEKDNDAMYAALLQYVESVENPYLRALLEAFFKKDEAFIVRFRKSSAAKAVHHGFIGGLLEHTLSVTNLCNYYCKAYPLLHRDLLLTAALCHDIGKTRELSVFPENDYTDEGNFLGHIVIGSEMISEKIAALDAEGSAYQGKFPAFLAAELKHCILSHHGEYEFGSPKKPALMEAVALNFADNTDAKMETLKEIFTGNAQTGWLGYQRLLESNLIATRDA